jgi:hypothetical protein
MVEADIIFAQESALTNEQKETLKYDVEQNL